MATSAAEIIQDALERIGVYAPSEPISATDQARALALLDQMIDTWAREHLFVYRLEAITWDLEAEQNSYTLGPLGLVANIQTARPGRVQTGPGAASVTLAGVTTPVDVVSALEWNVHYAPLYSDGTANPAISTGTPDTMFYDPDYPTAVIWLAPPPTIAGSATIQALRALTGFAAAATAYALAPGVKEALTANLAVLANPYFSSAPPSPVVLATAMHTREVLDRHNLTSRAMLGRSAAAQAPARGAGNV